MVEKKIVAFNMLNFEKTILDNTNSYSIIESFTTKEYAHLYVWSDCCLQLHNCNQKIK